MMERNHKKALHMFLVVYKQFGVDMINETQINLRNTPSFTTKKPTTHVILITQVSLKIALIK